MEFLYKRQLLLALIFLASQTIASHTCFSSYYKKIEDTATKTASKIKTVEEFEQAIKSNHFLIKNKLDYALEEDEKDGIENAHKWANLSIGPKINRDIKDFKGDFLVVGGGRSIGAITSISSSKEFLDKYGDEWRESGNKDKIARVEETEAEINEILKKYYTINIDTEADPDLLGSITSIGDTLSIPDNRFSTIRFEGVDALVFLNPDTLKILERITKANGKIIMDVTPMFARAVIIAFSGSKWEKQIYDQLDGKIYNDVTNNNMLQLTITN